MFGAWFYHERVRKSVAIFGAMFNDLHITRRSKGAVHSQIKVPIAYAPQRKFLERIQEMYDGEDAERQLAIRLPRMSFEMNNMQYDAVRQLPKVNTFKRKSEDTDAYLKFYTQTPYILTFELNIYAKTHDDCLQIVEQITPYFTPQYNVSVKPIDGQDDITEDVPVTLQSIAMSDDYEGGLEARRTIIYTLTFDMKVFFYGPKPKTGVITRVDVDLFQMEPEYYLGETVRVETDPRPPDSDYTIVEDIINKNMPEEIFLPTPDQTIGAHLDDGGNIVGSITINLTDYDTVIPGQGSLDTEYTLMNPESNSDRDLILTPDGVLIINIHEYPYSEDIIYCVDTIYGDPVCNTIHIEATPEGFNVLVTQQTNEQIGTQGNTIIATES